MTKDRISIFWFRRDLRLNDNHALWQALQSKFPTLPIFIFDEYFFKQFPSNDRRFNLIYDQLFQLNLELKKYQSGIQIYKGKTTEIFHHLLRKYDIASVFCNEDYEPYAIQRDHELQIMLQKVGIPFSTFKDQVIFHKDEVIKENGQPYTIYTPYKNKWISLFSLKHIKNYPSETLLHKLYQHHTPFPSKKDLGIINHLYHLKPLNLKNIAEYENIRDYPYRSGTSNASVYLRFGLISIRELIQNTININQHFIHELIWREFFMQILYHFPYVEHSNFKSQYNQLQWSNNEKHFELWTKGQTGYPLVDAGMRELNTTGYMHNRVRMIVASFLTKHLLIDWRWGEAYFAQHLLDYELSSNNGNWQWAASTGCDAVPYFRIFNPTTQIEKYDKKLEYIKQWIPDYHPQKYIAPIINHEEARHRALEAYKRIRLPN
ncbi:MAG: deoxyribodipyrimidine photo-lyase [Bacteroidales bacterium]|nr:deoxyribodipyrimidine photo-lyase [Bacteroidales bacterium]